MVRAPAAVGRVVRSGFSGDRVPMMRSSGRNMVITHCERFATVAPTGVGFEIAKYAVNPGLGAVFPWMCDVANRFDKYKFRSVKFRYIPQAAANAGTVALAFDFDPNDDAPASMSEATTFHDYVMSSIWQGVDLNLDLQNGDKLPQKNTRPGLPGADLDLNMYDVGNLYVMTEGAAAGMVGYIEVIYNVELYIHQVQAGVGGKISATAGLATDALFGTDSVADVDAVIPGSVTAANTFTFDGPFEGMIALNLAGTVFAGTAITNTGTATFGNIGGRFPTAATSWFGFGRVKAATGQTLILTVAAATVTASSCYFSRGAYKSLGA